MHAKLALGWRGARLGEWVAAILSCRALVAGSLLIAAANGIAGTVWMTSGGELLRVDESTGQVVARTAASDLQQFAGTSDGGVWVLEGPQLVHFDGNAQSQGQIALSELGYGNGTRVAVDAFDGSVWAITTQRLLLRIDPKGHLLTGYTLPGPASALAVALDESVWVAGDSLAWHFSPQGVLLGALSYGSQWSDAVTSIGVDSLRSRLWLVGRNTIGTASSSRNDASMHEVAIGEIRDATLDGRLGRLWVLTDSDLLGFDATARPIATIGLAAHGIENARALTYDAENGRLLINSVGSVTPLDASGEFDTPLALDNENPRLAAAPFALLPRITVFRPPAGASTTEPEPPVILRLDARCNDSPCDVDADYLSSLELSARLNGTPVSDRLTIDPALGAAFFTPSPPLSIGDNAFSAHATDRFGHASNAIDTHWTLLPAPSALVVEKAKNKPPTVTLTAPANNATFTPGSNIGLTAVASDSDGTVTKVDFYVGSTLIGTATASPYSVVWNNVPAGSYALTAKATDNRGATATSSPAVNITVAIPANDPPTISMVSPTDGSVIVASTSVVINASAADSDGTISKIDFYDGATLLGTVNGGAATLAASWTIDNVAAGVHVLKAIATDNGGATANASVTITSDTQPVVVLTQPMACLTSLAPANFTLSAAAVDPDGTVARVDFYQGSTLIGTSTVEPYTITWNNVAAGTYSLTATATDNLGVSGTSTTVTVAVAAPNAPPSVTLTSPADGAAYRAPATVSLAANATDSDGSVAKVEFYQGATLIGTSTAAPYTATWSSVPAGSYTLTAKATDNLGATTTSAPSNITVSPNAPPSVTLTSPTSGTNYFAPATIILTATASDNDGSVVRVNFYSGATLIGTSTTVPFGVSWLDVAPGTYTLTAQATDNDGTVTTSSPISVVVLGIAATVTTPADGTSIGDDNVLVTGTVQAPQNSAVFVNGVAAAVDISGNFFANNVPLEPGANPITVTVMTLDNAPVTQTTNATSTGVAPFTVSIDPQDGFAPLTTNLTIVDRAATPFQRIEIDTNNDGTAEATLATLPSDGPAATVTYPVPGVYTMRITAFDANNNVLYTTLRMVRAFDPAEQGTLLTQVYNNMLDRLRAGDAAGALNAFSSSVQPTYQSLFSQLGGNLPAVVAQFGAISSATFGLDFGELVVTKTRSGTTYAYPIELVRGFDGVWRIEGM